MEDFNFKKLRILIIDDDEWMRLLIKKYLNVFGVTEIIEAANGQEGLDLLNSNKPDVAICDVNMTPVNGFEFLERVRSGNTSFKKMPIIFITGDENAAYVLANQAPVIDPYLLKPISAQTLKSKIAELLT